MRILIANHWLKKAGGSETFTYTMATELARRGYQIELLTLVPGVISKRIKKATGARIHTTSTTIPSCDLALVNHRTCVQEIRGKGIAPIIQTCHGTTPSLEQPEAGADYYVAISQEVAGHMAKKGKPADAIIHNGVDLARFNIDKPLNRRARFALSLAHSEEGNQIIAQGCADARIKLITHNKHKNPRWDIENVMNQVDIVITLGRGAYEALACGRNVAVWDKRPYQAGMGDGMITPENIDEILETNCSGRKYRLPLTRNNVAKSLTEYNPDAEAQRAIAKQRFNMADALDKYLALWLTK